MSETAIQWTDHSFNPWRGCSKVAEGCRFCYAEKNVGVKLHGVKWGTEKQGGTRVVAADSYWKDPHKWNRWAVDPIASAAREDFPRRLRVFCASLADVFEDWTGDIVDHKGRTAWKDGIGYWYGERPSPTARKVTLNDVRKRMFETIDDTPNLDWQLLTKRPENIRKMWPFYCDPRTNGYQDNLRRNVWLGTSIANQADAEKNIPELLKCRDLASKLFLSVEPMVGPVDLAKFIGERFDCEYCGPVEKNYEFDGQCQHAVCKKCFTNWDDAGSTVTGAESDIDWVIVGGESGPNARPCKIEWVLDVVNQCKAAGVPCFVKQVGAKPWLDYYQDSTYRELAIDSGTVLDGRNFDKWDHQTHGQPHPKSVIELKLKDKKGGDWDEWPEDLRVRQFPLPVEKI